MADDKTPKAVWVPNHEILKQQYILQLNARQSTQKGGPIPSEGIPGSAELVAQGPEKPAPKEL